MDRFVAIAAGLDVQPALDEIARHPHEWMSPNANALLAISLIAGQNERMMESVLPETWKLLETALAHAAALHEGPATLCHARIGLMPPGEGLPPHWDGVDGVALRRYQLALVSEPGVALTVGGETKCPRPGEVWQIDASQIHSVTNGSAVDRITIVFDTRVG